MKILNSLQTFYSFLLIWFVQYLHYLILALNACQDPKNQQFLAASLTFTFNEECFAYFVLWLLTGTIVQRRFKRSRPFGKSNCSSR